MPSAQEEDLPERKPMTKNPHATFDWRLSVVPSDIDGLGHVNNLRYLAWMIDAAVAHSSHLGWTPRRYREEGRVWVVRHHRIEYRRPAMLGDDVVVETWIDSMERVSSLRRYRILRETDRALLADAETNWVYFDLAANRLMRIPDEMRAAFGRGPEED